MAAPAAAVLAQPPDAAQPKFEVASVRLAVQRPATTGVGERGGGNSVGGGGCPQSLKMDQGRVDMKCATLTVLIGYAFRLSPDRVKGPDWMGSTRFDIAATIPEGASKNQVPEMVQALLAERFKLAIHRGMTNQSIYALIVAKGGLRVKEAGAATPPTDSDAPAGTTTFYGGVTTSTTPHATTISNPAMGTVLATDAGDRRQRWEAPSITFAGLADLLEMVTPFFSSPVIDMTRLKGRYRLVLEVSLNDALMGPGGERTTQDMEAAVLKAFNDGLAKLGLKLERRKGPVESIVVDHVEKAPTEN
jgi:uncharacterized protein (TIGR03435 family)